MGVINDIQAIGKILQKAGNIELYERLLAIQEKSLELIEENGNLKKEIGRLKEELKVKKAIKFFEGEGYWLLNKKGEKEDGPFCLGCYDSKKTLARLTSVEGMKSKTCSVCGKRFPIKIGLGKVYYE